MKKLIVVTLALCAGILLADGTNAVDRAAVLRERKRRSGTIQERLRRIYGDKIVKPGVGKGKIVFVNAQDVLPAADLAAWVKDVSYQHMLTMEAVKGEAVTPATAAAAAAKTGANATVFLLSDDTLPLSLVAYEEGWAIANVGRVAAGVPKAIGAARAKKLVLRTMGNLCGAGESMFGVPFMWPAKTPADFDLLVMQPIIPPPFIAAIGTHMKRAGMEPIEVATYQAACQQGWAPAPTNDIEKAIWDKVHVIPAKPLTIEHKKGK